MADPTPEDHIEELAREIHVLGESPSYWPVRQQFSAAGRWRVYFNRHGAAPMVWCVAPESGGFEIAVRHVVITATTETIYHPKGTPDDEDGRPSAWICAHGMLTVFLDGNARIEAT